MILPEATLGVLGGGQLGRMFTVAARTMGYKVIVLDPDPVSPAAALANEHLQKEYTDPQALDYLAAQCAAVTTEFENVPVAALRTLEAQCLVRPGADAVAYAQDRIREKTFIRDCGLATAPFHPVHNAAELEAALATVRLPAILKTAALGYDGKGQRPVTDPAQAHAAFAELGNTPCVLEERVDLQMELSVLVARSIRGEIAVYPPGENIHVHGILDTSIVPARTSADVIERATSMARSLAEQLDYCGLLAVEFFLTKDNELLINEIAPRPHNSGHYTLDACLTNQFEQQVRMLCGLPPGDTRLMSPVVMINLLGDLWANGEPGWDKLFQHPHAKLHLYGKQSARPGRKMGHYNVLDADVDQALAVAQQIYKAIGTG
ncbi:MAG: 5-(carboxyamino)imidazole ribonucleotide synthase [Gammaproteobacteria bacterium]